LRIDSMLIDTHAHLDFNDFSQDISLVIERARGADVTHIISVGVDLASSHKCIEIAHNYANVYASVGIHPHDASKVKGNEFIQTIRELIHKDKVIALGEIGLDYYRNLSPAEEQKDLFRTFLELHKESGLPLILHARDSFDDLFIILRETIGDSNIKGVMHCFSGDASVLHEALSLGLYISFTGSITYKKNDALRSLVVKVPDERLLLETDSPYLAPQSQRGKRNEPAFLTEIARFIAQLRGIRIDDLARITTYNCQKLLGFPIINMTPQIVYRIRDSLYINTTIQCSNECQFCVRFHGDIVKGHNLRITTDPSVSEVIKEINYYQGNFKEVVFCGFGEPFIRLDFIKSVAHELKKQNIYIRIDTNGQGNLIHKRNVLPELQGLIDEVCVSLNTPNEKLYNEICRPHLGKNVYAGIIDFIQEAKKIIPRVVITFLDLPQVNIEEMKQKAQALGVAYRMRHYNKVG